MFDKVEVIGSVNIDGIRKLFPDSKQTRREDLNQLTDDIVQGRVHVKGWGVN